jgi:hypothetical protein
MRRKRTEVLSTSPCLIVSDLHRAALAKTGEG